MAHWESDNRQFKQIHEVIEKSKKMITENKPVHSVDQLLSSFLGLIGLSLWPLTHPLVEHQPAKRKCHFDFILQESKPRMVDLTGICSQRVDNNLSKKELDNLQFHKR